METKFTPGPWNVEFDDTGGYDSMSAGYRIGAPDYHREVCTVEVDSWRFDKPEMSLDWDDYHAENESAAADAALIAAAPDMYAALEDVTNDLEAYVDAQYMKDGKVYHPAMQSRYDRDIEPVVNARAALAKARGEQ